MNNALIFSLSLLGTIALSAAEKDTRTEAFTVKPGGTLQMKVDRGSITVLTAAEEKVKVQVVRELKRGSDEQAREAYEQHKIEISQEGNDIRIQTERDGGLLGGFRDAFKNLHVEYTITIPSRFNLDLRTSGGTIDVADLEGAVKLQTSGGNLRLATVKGNISGHTSGGNIQLESGTGNADLHTSGGEIKVGEINGDIVAKTTGGNMTLKNVSGNADLSTTGGDVTVGSAKGYVKATTTGGNVKAQIEQSIAGESSLKTTGGNIDVRLDGKAAINLNAKTTGGNLKSDFEGEFNKPGNKFVGQINGGGPELTLATTGGNISIRRK